MNYTYENENGRKVSGNAALLHQIKLEGGHDAYVKHRQMAAISNFLNSPEMQELMETQAQYYAARNNIEVTNCR